MYVLRFSNVRRLTVMALAVVLVGATAWIARPVEPAQATPPPVAGDVSTIAGGFSAPEIESPNATVQVGTTLYIAQWQDTIIARDLTTGRQTHFAGVYNGGFDPDGGPAATTALGSPANLIADHDGNLYVSTSDWPNACTIRRIDADAPHIVTTVVGTTGACGYSGDGTASAASIPGIAQMVIDTSGEHLYFVAWGGDVTRVDLVDDTIAVVAGWGSSPPDSAASAADAQFFGAVAIAIDSADNLYVVDQNANAIYRIAADFGSVTTVVGDYVNGSLGRGYADGALATAQFDLQGWLQDTYENPVLAVAPDDDLLVFDSGNQVLRRIDGATGTVSTMGGQLGVRGYAGDGGPFAAAELDGMRPFNVVGDDMYFATSGWANNSWENQVRHVDLATGIITNAKPMTFVGDGGLATDATLSQPIDLARVGDDLYIAEQMGHRIRKVDVATGIITTIAGTGTPGATLATVPAATAQLAGPRSLAYDGSGLLTVGMDTLVRRIDFATGLISVVAGTGVPGFVDGPVATAQFSQGVTGVTVDTAGRIYVADSDNAAIRCIGCDGPGIVSTVAGLLATDPDFKTPADCDSDHDVYNGQDMTFCPPAADGNALDTFLSMPARVTIDPEGRVVFTEMLGGVVRRINDDGTLTTIAGVLGDLSRSGADGTPATSASIAGPAALRYDAAGNLFIGEVGGNLLDLINGNYGALMSWQPGITRVAGNGTIERYAGGGLVLPPTAPTEGPRLSATFAFPTAFAQDAGTHMYVADILNNRIRRIEGVKPNVTASASGGPYVTGLGGKVTATVRNSGSGYATGPIRLSVTLPTGLRYVGVNSPDFASANAGWTCSASGALVDCERPENLAPSGHLDLQLEVVADGSVTGDVSVEVHAGSDSDDADEDNKVFVLGTSIVSPKLRKAASGGYTMFGADGGTFAFGDDDWPGAWRTSNVVDGDSCGSIALALRKDGAVLWNNDTVNAALVGQLRADAVGLDAIDDCGIYRIAAADGGVFTFGVEYYGSLGGLALNAPVVDIAGRKSGYRLVGADGGVFAFGDHRFFGSLGGTPLNQPVVTIVDTPSGEGYWLIASDGGVFAFGDAPFFGSTGGVALNEPIVDLVPTTTGAGYWLIGADGGVFTFGDATMHGSLAGHHLHAPIVAAS